MNPGGRGSLPGAQMGTTKGRWEFIGLRVPEPRACEGVDMEEFILQVMKSEGVRSPSYELRNREYSIGRRMSVIQTT